VIEIPFNEVETYSLPDEITGRNGCRYRILENLGRGGNGAVFECEEVTTGETFALKLLLKLNYFRSVRFKREVQIIEELTHEHVITYITNGVVLGTRNQLWKSKKVVIPFVVMRKADSSLQKLLEASNSPLGFEEYYGQFVGLSKALEQLHSVAIHRDIKPDNILVSGTIWQISDFGLCALVEEQEEQLTRADEAVGPRYWMSPEAISKAMGLGDEISYCSDLFQLASVFWFVVTRRPPIGVVTMEDWTGPYDLGQLLLDTLQHDPSRRPKSTVEFIEKLEAVKFVHPQPDIPVTQIPEASV
jgi:serine/threonine-protein kinase